MLGTNLRGTAAPDVAGNLQPSRFSSLTRVLGPDVLAVMLTVLGAALRFYQLGNRSLWLDEVLTANFVRYQTLAEVLTRIHDYPDEMPAIYILVWILRGLGGAEQVVRLPSALAGSGCVLAIYCLARTLGRPRVGLVAALLMAVLPFSVWYGQEVPAYALLMLLTTLQMLFAYRVVRNRRLLDWLWFVVCCVLNLYTHFLSLAVTGAAFAFIGAAIVLESIPVLAKVNLGTKNTSAHRITFGIDTAAISTAVTLTMSVSRASVEFAGTSLRQCATRLGAVALAAVVVVAFYSPWLPFLVYFLNSGNLGFGRVRQDHAATLADVTNLLAAFDFTGILVILLVIGVISVVWQGFHRRWSEALLLGVWLTVPIAGLWLRIGAGTLTLLPRYLSFLFPALVLIAAVGLDGVASAGRRLAARAWGSRPRPTLGRMIFVLVYAALIGGFLVQKIPALRDSYLQGKDDYRGAAARIVASSPPDSVIIALGGCSQFVVDGLDYYLWLQHSTIATFDGIHMDDRSFEKLRQSSGQVWGAVFMACGPPIENDIGRAPTGGDTKIEVSPLTGLTLVRHRVPDEKPLEAAQALLRWAGAFRPEALAQAALLQTVSGGVTLGENLLPPPSVVGGYETQRQWTVGSGAAVGPDGSSFVLVPSGPMVNVTLRLPGLIAGDNYILSFKCRNGSLQGEQRVFVTTNNAAGQSLETFPDGAGYPCASASTWTAGEFAFSAPAGVQLATIWLRATGSGSAEFDNVELRRAQ